MQQYQEGMTATGPNGETAVFRGGQWVVMPSQTPSPMITQAAPPDYPYKGPQAAATLGKTQADVANAATQSHVNAATAPDQIALAHAQTLKAQADAEAAQRNLAADQSTASPDQQKRMSALGNDEVLAAIDRARNGVNAGMSSGYVTRLPGIMQPQGAVDLSGDIRTVASRITLDTLAKLKQLSPTGASGLGSLSNTEGELLRDSVASLDPKLSKDKLLENLAAVEKHYRNVRAIMDGQDPTDPKVAARYGIAALPDNQQPNALAQGGYRQEADPALKGVNNRIRSMIGAGANANDIVAYMNQVQPGLGDEKAASVKDAVTFRAQNPSVSLDKYPISVEMRDVPMSTTRQLFNGGAQTPFGAFVMGAGDTISGGVLDNLTGNPALARAGMQAVAQQNPKMSLAGQLTGGALAAAGLENAVGGLGAKWAPRVGDALYGAAYGAGSTDEGNRLTGALQGAGVGALGGMIGRTATRAAGGALTGVRDASAQYLRNAGVPMTLGQAAANSGALGKYLKGREDRLAGFSGIGDKINALRRQGVEGFNRAAFKEGLAPIGGQVQGQLGEQAVGEADNLIGKAYSDALNGVRLQADPQFAAGMQPIVQQARNLPGEMADNANYTLAQRVGASMGPNGEMTGNNFQQAVRGLEGDARAVRNQPYGHDFGDVAKGARGQLEGMLERQSPGSLDQYLAANAAYRNHSILADSVASGMNTDGLFTPAQLGQAARSNARKYTGRISAATEDRPFFELQRAGQQILPSKVPDSGTAGRAAADGGLTSTLRAMGRNTVNAPFYSDGTQEAINKLLLDRPDALVKAGAALAKKNRYGGLFGAPLLLDRGPLAVAQPY